jgi:tRNA modification GTPase
LADTAGLRAAADALEAEGVARAERQVTEADLVIFVADTSAAWNERVYEDVRRGARRALIVAHNKCDLARQPADERPIGVEVSAKTGGGIEALLAEITKAIVPDPPRCGEAVPFTVKQVGVLEEVRNHLIKHDFVAARRHLLSLCGAL